MRYDYSLLADWNEERMVAHPYEELIRHGWHALTDLLEQPFLPQENEPPLVIHNGNVQHPQEWMPAYGSTSLYGPYLNGSSVMQAHADCLSPWLAAFCQDLERTFPCVYANTYLTPPQSRALNLHADDRDVLVVQLVGSKHWQVMKEVPIEFPYPHEQVGKGDLQVPKHVLEGGEALTCTLQPGDVLYIPRGHCHQAKCTDDLSFHVTIAVATFDWSLAGMIHQATKNILTSVPDYRKGILPLEGLDPQDPNKVLQQQIDNAMETLREQITPDAILCNLQARVQPHRQRAKVNRDRQLERFRSRKSLAPSPLPVGILAAKQVNFRTRLRAATDEEREQLPRKVQLQVREELANDVESILTELRGDPSLEYSLAELQSRRRTSTIWCDLAWLGLAKQAVEVGELALAE
jgi:hypothetical protein